MSESNTFDEATFIENMTDTTTFSADFLEELVDLIEALGYTLVESDSWLLGFCVQKINWEILNSCNVSEVPEGLYKDAEGLILAEFLTSMITRGVISGTAAFNFEGAVKQLQEGDTSITFAVDATSGDEGKLNAFIAALQGARNHFVTYRRLKW